jgi:Uma2 family endonuclease
VTLLSRFPCGRRAGPIEVHPDLAIEVLSPDDRADRVQNRV